MIPFELHWQGGIAARCFRELRPQVEQLPWGSLRADDHRPELVARARFAWTQGALNEHTTAAALAALLQQLLRVNAPVDLVGMAGDFIADEMGHVELNARMAMELGGAPRRLVDFAEQLPQVTATAPLLRACELALRVCCVGEALSAPLLAATAQAANHPLTRAVLQIIARDEPHHALLGWLVLEWGLPQLSVPDRCHLAQVAEQEMTALWAEQAQYYGRRDEPEPSDEEVCALGWLPAAQHASLTRHIMRHDIRDRLRAYGIAASPAFLS